jgi:hypothetical protein
VFIKLPSLAYTFFNSPIILASRISKIIRKIGHRNFEITGHDQFEMTGHAPETTGHDDVKYASCRIPPQVRLNLDPMEYITRLQLLNVIW